MYTNFPVRVRFYGNVVPYIMGWVIGPVVNKDLDDLEQMYWVEWDNEPSSPSREPFGKLMVVS